MNQKNKNAFLQISTVFGTRWLLKHVLKQDHLDMYVTVSFEVNNTANTEATRIMFFL